MQAFFQGARESCWIVNPCLKRFCAETLYTIPKPTFFNFAFFPFLALRAMDSGPAPGKKRKTTHSVTLEKDSGDGESQLLNLLYESWSWGQISPQFVIKIISAAVQDLDAQCTQRWRQHTRPRHEQNCHRTLRLAKLYVVFIFVLWSTM